MMIENFEQSSKIRAKSELYHYHYQYNINEFFQP